MIKNMNTSIGEWGKNINRHFTKWNVQIANEYVTNVIYMKDQRDVAKIKHHCLSIQCEKK